jgi:hypothetical protein
MYSGYIVNRINQKQLFFRIIQVVSPSTTSRTSLEIYKKRRQAKLRLINNLSQQTKTSLLAVSLEPGLLAKGLRKGWSNGEYKIWHKPDLSLRTLLEHCIFFHILYIIRISYNIKTAFFLAFLGIIIDCKIVRNNFY